MDYSIKMIVVDDDLDVCETLQEYFLLQGYDVIIASNGNELKKALATFVPHIIVLDLNMPGDDGFVLARYLYEHTDAAVIMLTGSQNPVDMIVGLEVGADDFVSKPFDLRGLHARVKSVLRRTFNESPSKKNITHTSKSLIKVGKCLFDPEQLKLWDGEKEVALTSKEHDLLLVLLANPNQPLSRDSLLALEHKDNSENFDRSIDSRITRLRKKIEANPEKPVAIKTVRNIGYVYEPA